MTDLERRLTERLIRRDAEIERLRTGISDALGRLDASLLTNAEHSQAATFLRAALKNDGL